MSQHRATATVTPLADANLFDISAPMRISYSRSSISGRPLFSYADAELDLDLGGPDLTRVDTALGELVTVTLQDAVDAFVRTFTLVVPTIRLAMGDEVEFDTLGIETTDRSGAFVPAPGPSGVLQTFRIHELHGVAKLVAF